MNRIHTTIHLKQADNIGIEKANKEIVETWESRKRQLLWKTILKKVSFEFSLED